MIFSQKVRLLTPLVATMALGISFAQEPVSSSQEQTANVPIEKSNASDTEKQLPATVENEKEGVNDAGQTVPTVVIESNKSRRAEEKPVDKEPLPAEKNADEVVAVENNENKSTEEDPIDKIVEQAELYLYGDGVKADLAKAAELYGQAADMGSPKAMLRLSTMHRRGQGVAKDEAKAFALVQKAAELGYAPAQASLGTFYHEGIGVAQDHQQYRNWTKKAADNGYVMAMIIESNALEEDADNPEAKKQADEYVSKAKELATPQEIYSIAYSFHHGLRLPQDDEKAIQWALEGADRGEVNAMYLLGELRWTQRNFPEATSWFEKAAENGLLAAQLQTGRIYRDGEDGVRPNPVKAVKWLSISAKNGDKEDALSLAILLKTGPKSVQDPKKAQEWLEIYLEDANPDELHDLSEKYWKGLGVRKNYDIAGAVALAGLQKGDQRYLCEFAEKLSTPNWIKSDFVTAYVLLNDCLLETPEDMDLQKGFADLEQKMSAYQLQKAQQLDSEEALENYLKTHKPNIE